MTEATPLVTEIIAEALLPGPLEEPTALLTALQEEGTPLMVFMRGDEDRIIEKATEQDFGFLRFLNMRAESVDNAPKRWTGLIRWLLASTKDWKKSGDEQMRTLVAILLTSRWCGCATDLWHLFPDEKKPSVEFLNILSSFISKLQLSYSVPESTSPPIWESEFVEAFLISFC